MTFTAAISHSLCRDEFFEQEGNMCTLQIICFLGGVQLT